ncbi:MAG: hypothetical protein NTV51_06365 [Verrucomicrobia bacterium]|nr:hypothetical protein [Verrucomicrobiota bacterium]
MKDATFKFARAKNGLCIFAEVAVELEASDSRLTVEFACSGRGFYSQGYIEEVPAVGYDDWKAGAKAGVLFALKIANRPSCEVRITKIEGLSTDTNPTAVGAAAAFATWKALEFEPPADMMGKLEKQAFAGYRKPEGEVPVFE